MREKIKYFCFTFLLFFGLAKCSKNCRKIDPKDEHFRSVVFAEAHGVGLGSQLFVYALMSQLRAEHNFETFVSKECRAILSKVFTVTSLSDVPVFEETFCVEHPSLVGHFEGLENCKIIPKGNYVCKRDCGSSLKSWTALIVGYIALCYWLYSDNFDQSLNNDDS